MISGAAKEALRGSIAALGFEEVRFTNLELVPPTRLQAWVDAGYHADMEWFTRSIEKRLNPSLVLPDACSVAMLGVNYLPEEGRARQQKGFAKYSLYSDYHDTVLVGAKRVGALLESAYGLESGDYRYYVDTGPVMERGWAAAAGMGWQGKNGMLISKEHGNWLLLASVFMKLEIEPDPPLKKKAAPAEQARAELGLLCGKCVRCMDACPTSAIVEPGIVNSARCISYQTIENKGVIPRQLRAGIGSRIFGCDICLDVCPWNRFAQAGRMQLLESRYEVAELGLLELLRMQPEDFRRIFKGMPVKRAKLRGLKRNACVAAGNLLEWPDWWPKDKASPSEKAAWVAEVVSVLRGLAEADEEPLVRAHAVWAIRRLRGAAADIELAAARSREQSEMVLVEYEGEE